MRKLIRTNKSTIITTMGRGKIEMKRIENRTNRQVTFSKRRQGLIKKTRELAVLCDAQIGLIVFSGTGKLHTFESPDSSMEQIIQRYLNNQGIQLPVHDNREEVYQEVQVLKEAVHTTEQNIRQYLGEELGPLPLEDLHKHEQQLESSLNIIRARKVFLQHGTQLMQQQLENLRKKELMLQTDNGNMYRWLMGGGQIHEQQQQQQQQVMEHFPFFGEDQPSSSTFLQLATSSSSPHEFYNYHRLQPTHPNLHDYE